MLDWDNFEALTFDCFGTLIDWESGIWDVLRPVFLAHNIDADRDRVLELYAKTEARLETEKYREYRVVLRRTIEVICSALGFHATELELKSFVQSMARWAPFPDSTIALQALQRKYKLGIISNVDDDLFGDATRQLGVNFEWIITAQQARCYKPAIQIFQLAFQRIGLPKHRILHVAQSLFHDIAPARSLGLTTVWVNRRHDKHGWGATLAANAIPDWEVRDLRTLVSTVGLGEL